MNEIDKIAEIPFQEINDIPKLIKDFLDKKLEDFNQDIFEFGRVSQKVNEKKSSFTTEKRTILKEALQRQLSLFHLTEKQKNHLDKLSDENTFTVTTGHQLNLFTGPAYFMYKIVQTIKLADELNEKFNENHFVPVFWMATEDHDFEEINHFYTENGFYEISAPSGTAVGRINIQEDQFIDSFEEEFKDTAFGKELIELIKNAYQIGNSLTQATSTLVQHLFSEYGLLMIDGDDSVLKKQMQPVFRKELLDEHVFQSTKNTVDFLKKQYGKVQVNPREINLFYLSETRNRIEKSDSTYSVVDTNIRFSEEEILNELENHPERFSPNALLRPVYQESVLPNIAYIGGNAEVMYWLELKEYFRDIHLPYPFIIPRNSLLFVKRKYLNKAEKLGLAITDFLDSSEHLVKKQLLHQSGILEEINKNEVQLKKSFEDLKNISEQTDISFRNLVTAEETRQLKSFEKMRHRLLRAEKIKEHEKVERIEQLFLDIHPKKKWQERRYNFSTFYSDFGKTWIEKSYKEMNVEKSQLIIFSI